MGEVKEQVSISRLVVEKQIILIVEAQRSSGFDKFTVSFLLPPNSQLLPFSVMPSLVLATGILKFGFVFSVVSLWWLLCLSKLEMLWNDLLTCYQGIPLFLKAGFGGVYTVEHEREREYWRLFSVIVIVIVLYLQVPFECYPLVFISRKILCLNTLFPELFT